MLARSFPLFLILALGLSAQAFSGSEPAVCVEDDADPIPVHRTPPAYPQPAVMFCLQGTVALEFTIDKTGRVGDIEVIDSNPPDIFDRAATRAASQWWFAPRCVNGVPVEDRHRTAIDFKLEFDPEECPDAIERIDDTLLEFIGKVGASYALLAELNLHGVNDLVLAELKASLAPEFDGELGQIEQFHRLTIEDLMSDMQKAAGQEVNHYLPLLIYIPDHTPQPDDMGPETIMAMRDWMLDRLRRQQQRTEAAWTEYSALRSAVEMDVEVLELLIEPFLGPLEDPDTKESPFQREFDLVDELLSLFEQSAGGWQWQTHGIVFDSPIDQESYEHLRLTLLQIHLERGNDRFNVLRGFEDYRP